MKKVIIISALLLITPTAYASEIAGTRVAGDVAIECPAGSGRGLEINATTKETWSYCVEIQRPTQEKITQQVKQEIPQILTAQKNADAPKVELETTIITEPVVDLTQPRPTKIDVNATTQVVTVFELTNAEVIKKAEQMAIHNARQIAQQTSKDEAIANPGTEYCAKWQSGAETGQECFLEPVKATTKEIDLWLEAWQKIMAIIGWAWWLS